jgi:ABC-type lipoprotein export system ATPase subunit
MKNIGIGGYKAINENIEIELAPITLLIGPNGSGKSSVINMLRASNKLIDSRNKLICQGFYESFDFKMDKQKLNKFKLNNLVITEFYPNLTLSNPLTDDGKFKKSDLNNKRENPNIELCLPFRLSFFEDEFKIQFVYSLSGFSEMILDKLSIINKSLNSTFFEIEMNRETHSIRNGSFKESNDKKSLINPKYKIDIEYILAFLDKKLLENKSEFSNLSQLDDFSFIQPTQSDMDSAMSQLDDDAKQAKELLVNYIKGLNSNFGDCKQCKVEELNELGNSKQIKKLQLEHLYLFEKLKSNIFFDFNKKNDELYFLNESYSGLIEDINFEIINRLNNGLFWGDAIEGVDFLSLKSSNFLNQTSQSEYYNWFFEGLGHILQEKHEFESGLNFKGLSSFGAYIFNEFVFENISIGFYNLNNYLEDHDYISLNRGGKIDVLRKLEQNIEFLKLLGIDESPTVSFIKNHINNFNIPKSLEFGNIEEYISSFKFEDNDGFDLGYGHEKLIPIINQLAFPTNPISDDMIASLLKNNCYMLGMDDIKFLFFQKRKLFIIEEPESNLHPNNQSKLADLFIDAAWKFGHQFVIETHSEYFVRKLQYYVATGKIDPKVVQIYYFDQNNNRQTSIRSVNILKDGSLTDNLGTGFYDESDKIALELYRSRQINLN